MPRQVAWQRRCQRRPQWGSRRSRWARARRPCQSSRIRRRSSRAGALLRARGGGRLRGSSRRSSSGQRRMPRRARQRRRGDDRQPAPQRPRPPRSSKLRPPLRSQRLRSSSSGLRPSPRRPCSSRGRPSASLRHPHLQQHQPPRGPVQPALPQDGAAAKAQQVAVDDGEFPPLGASLTKPARPTYAYSLTKKAPSEPPAAEDQPCPSAAPLPAQKASKPRGGQEALRRQQVVAAAGR